ncbi:Dynein intermediate chain 2, ciliary-related protein [Histomonas meleagridis]|uniref:Dynein intermediate chain 2, ciliary-related protein n=1 Tax=Histomonas meleagridis TaxID=135588 RepID=UPI003559664A|nr:Dynein intermediate chain 2, ciliary-related protein [Histomonas meleagridis]KAH0800385.1 Dynein intermediate chain 2, ciliary-related protein [Histomonas meleagridis]
METEVNIVISETPTIFLFQQQSSIESFATDRAQEIQEKNKRYTQYCEAMATSENFVSRESLTFHLFIKDKETQTNRITKVDESTDVYLHDFYDVNENKNQEEQVSPITVLHESLHPLSSYLWTETSEETLKDPNAKVDFGPNTEESNATLHNMKDINLSLFAIERMVQQNIYLDKFISYKSLTQKVDKPGIEPLIQFQCPLTYLRKVTSISFNSQATNFFAASYGLPQQGHSPNSGLICVWNVMNPGYPERVIETEEVPTSIKFSEGVPYLLASGFSNGSIGIYDIRPKKCECIAKSSVDKGSHEGSVGEVTFQQRTDTRVRSEAVVSVAYGGRVTQWTVANGLEHKDLVVLKKLKVLSKEGKAQMLRYEDLHCVSFSKSQPNTYVVGSEDGAIFVCDAQYNEDFIQKLLFHFRAVLSVRFSPIVPNWFISGSCDGSAAIWNTSRQTPVTAFYLGKSTFNVIEWSPISGTVFAAACSDGECRIWDISLDSVDPVAKFIPFDKKELTALDWSPKLPVFICGNTNGVIHLAKVVGVQSLVSGNDIEMEKKRFESVIQLISNQE